MGVFQQLVHLSLKDAILQGGEFLSSPQNDVSIHLSPDNTLVIVAPGDRLAPRVDDQAAAGKPCTPVDSNAIR
jgi:hypothetical protein